MTMAELKLPYAERINPAGASDAGERPIPAEGGVLAGGGGPELVDPFDGFFDDQSAAADLDPLIDTAAARRWMRSMRWGMRSDLYTFQQPLEGRAGARIVRNGLEVILLSSYDYLGLIGHPSLAAAATRAIEKYGTGTGGVRLLTGSSVQHQQLERRLAEFIGVEAAMTFNSGYSANIGVLSALFGPRDLVVADVLVHRSIRDGCRLAGVPMVTFQHNDVGDLERLLQSARCGGRVCILVDGIYSMEGDICPLPEILRLKREAGAFLMVDEAHSLGVLGPRGRGIAEHFGVPPTDVDLFTGSLTKSIPASGGYVAGRRTVIIYLQHHAPTFLFSGALAPPAAAAAKTALDVIAAEPERLERLWRNVARLRDGLTTLGLDVGPAAGPLIPVVTGSEERAYRFARELLRRGVVATAVAHPAVPRGAARLRLCPTAAHRPTDIDEAIEAFRSVRRSFLMSTTPRAVPASEGVPDAGRRPLSRPAPRSRETTVKVCSDVTDVDASEWDALAGPDDLLATHRFVRVCQDAGIAEAVYRHVRVYQSGRLAAVATLTRMAVRLDLLASNRTRAVTDSIRSLYPAVLRVPVLFCGLPVSFGQSMLRFSDGVDRGRAVREIAGLSRELSRELGCELICFKEFGPAEVADLEPLVDAGFLRAPSPGYCRLRVRWRSYVEFLSRMRAGYRRQAMQDEAAARARGLRVRVVEDLATVSDHLHRLYLNVMARAKMKLEVLPPQFLPALKEHFPGQTKALLLDRDDETVAMAVLLSAQRTMTFLLAGLEDWPARANDTYPWLLNRVVAEGLLADVEWLDMGQTSYAAKTRLGASIEPRWIYLRSRTRALHVLLRAFSPLLFPATAPPVRHVFKACAPLTG